MKRHIQQNYFKILLSLVFSTLLVAGCATKPPEKMLRVSNARWETKAVIKNLKDGGVNQLSIDIMSIRDTRARFEISALFGTPVASLVMSPQDISFIYYPQKRFFYGKNSERAFAHLINIPLHPMNLSYIAYDEPIRGPGWQCKNDAAGMIASCEQPERHISVKWLDRNGGAKRVTINSPEFEMMWRFKEPQTSVQFKPNTFTLSQPEGFKAVQIH